MYQCLIMTDSCADLPAEYYQEHQVECIKMTYIEGDEMHPDNALAAETDAFYQRMRAGARATTSQINMQVFLARFRELQEQGLPIVYICFSSKLSASYLSACAAAEAALAERPQPQIYVIDSQGASTGLGLLVHHAVLLRDGGASAEEIVAWMKENIYRANHLFTVTDLQYLYRGGRVSAASAFLGNALNIRPLLWVDEFGGLALWSKERGDKRLLAAMAQRFGETCEDYQQTIFISHADYPLAAQALKEELENRYGCTDIRLGRLGPVVGAHTGPLAYALFYLGKDRREQAKEKK